MSELRTYSVSGKGREPLVEYMLDALVSAGCRILSRPKANEAPFRITFETAAGERMGIIAYAFTANTRTTRNRPVDEHRFQVKYGSSDGEQHELWQDPYGVYTTLFLGIDPDLGIFVAADPVFHNPTRFFISVEFKRSNVDTILDQGWDVWERDSRGSSEPVEILVGGTKANFLRYVRFERAATGEDQGHRQLLAERAFEDSAESDVLFQAGQVPHEYEQRRMHALAAEFEMSETEVLDLIENASRLKMAVRGWVAEEHLVRVLSRTDGVTECRRLTGEGGPDVELVYLNSRVLTVECKNVLRKTAGNLPRLDFQRTRASKGDPCSRYYSPRDFDLIAACVHPVTLSWEFRYALPGALDRRKLDCPDKLNNNVRLDHRWVSDPTELLGTFVLK